MMARISESKALKKHISCDCKSKFDSRKCNSNYKWNKECCRCECKNLIKHAKDFIWDPSTYACEIDKYSKIIVVDSVVTCMRTDAVALSYEKPIKTAPIYFNEKRCRKFLFVNCLFTYYHITIDNH